MAVPESPQPATHTWMNPMSHSGQALNTINDTDPFAMRYWARQLRLSEAELRRVIAQVGTDLQAVRQCANRPPAPRRGTIRRHGG